VTFGQGIKVEEGLFGGVFGVETATRDRVLLSLFGPREVEIAAQAVGDGEVGLLDAAEHLLVEEFLKGFGVVKDGVGVGAFRVEVSEHFGALFVVEPGVFVDAAVSVESSDGCDRAGTAMLGSGFIDLSEFRAARFGEPGKVNQVRLAILYTGMAQETEIKLRIEDVREFLAKLRALGARAVTGGPVAGRTGRVFESNLLFDTAEEDLRKRGQLLRIRTESSAKLAMRSGGKRSGPNARRALMTFKRPVNGTGEWKEEEAERSRHKVREEIELEVADAAALTRIIEALGMRNWFRYEKFRTTFQLPESQRWAKGLLIELDETPIGTFVELEGPATAIDEAAKRLGFATRDYIVMNYFSLYRAECVRRGEKPEHMVFRKRK